NYQWLIPQLQGQRLTLSFATNGLAQLWQDDTLLAQNTATGANRTTNVILNINHVGGEWDFNQNNFVDTGKSDRTGTNSFQRTNATYNLLYAFEPHWDWLKSRQRQLDRYRSRGLGDTSREIVSETLNIMGLTWQLQSEAAGQALATQMDVSRQHYHRMGRMAQEAGQGYYVDA